MPCYLPHHSQDYTLSLLYSKLNIRKKSTTLFYTSSFKANNKNKKKEEQVGCCCYSFISLLFRLGIYLGIWKVLNFERRGCGSKVKLTDQLSVYFKHPCVFSAGSIHPFFLILVYICYLYDFVCLCIHLLLAVFFLDIYCFPIDWGSSVTDEGWLICLLLHKLSFDWQDGSHGREKIF